MTTKDTKDTKAEYPAVWFERDFDPKAKLMQLKGRDYLDVQNRMLWFIQDQRYFIATGMAQQAFEVQTELVELDRERGFAHFKTYVRDVFGNEATMYGSETAKDFGDFAEKASTKSLGRALLALGYGTAFAQEMDEGERVVDSPRERTQAQSQQAARANQANDGGGAPALSLNMEHLPLGTPRDTVAAFAKAQGLDRETWQRIEEKHKGALNLMWVEIRSALVPPVRR